jgi:signal transduction histidine kinase
MPKAGYLILFVMLCSNLIAQQPKIIFDHYGFSEGFTSRGAWHVVKSPDGLLWITGDAGLARYNGKTFTYYQHNIADSTTIANNRTFSIAADKRGMIWVAAESGLDMFDPLTNRFHHCYMMQDNKKQYIDIWVYDIYCDDESGKVWVATGMGLFYIKPGSCEMVRAPVVAAAEKIAGDRFMCMAKNKNSREMWLCGSNGFYKYDTQTGQFAAYHIPQRMSRLANNDNLLTVYTDNSNTIWLGGMKRGLVSYNIATGSFETYNYNSLPGGENTVLDIEQTGRAGEEDVLWLSTGSGLATFNRVSKKFTFYTTGIADDRRGVKGRTVKLYPDGKDALWIAAEMGLHKYDYASQIFNTVDLGRLAPGLVGSYPLYGLCFEKNTEPGKEVVWISIPFQPVYKYHFATKKLERVPRAISEYIDMKYTGLQTIFIDHNNILWAGITSQGLIGYDITAGKIVYREKDFLAADNFVTTLAEDARGNLWVGTNTGLFVMDKSRKDCIPVKRLNELLAEKKLPGKITSICAATAGRIWFVMPEPGYKSVFGYYSSETGSVNLFDQSVDNEIPKAEVMQKIASKNGYVYVSTSDGLLLVDITGKKEKFTMLNKSAGLLQDVLYELQADADGNIWCGGIFGISCYKPAEKVFVNFSYLENGISDDYYQKMLALAPASGNIILGDAASFHYFNPKDIQGLAAPAVIFGSFSVFDKPFYSYSQLLTRPEIILKHNQNAVAIEFVALSYTNSAQNQYSWKLEGLGEEWHTSTENIASYNNLAPGNYKLLVKAANSRGGWTQEPVTLAFSIIPPFYKTWWFMLLVIAAIVSAVYYLVRLRIKRLKEKYQLRNRIAGDLHDEIGSTITSINILSNVSRQAMDQHPEKAREMLGQIALQSKQIQQNMSDIVWSIRPDNEKVENLLVRMNEYVAQTLEPLQITTRFNADRLQTDLILPLHYRKEVLLIFKEAVNNIAKHACATAVDITILQSRKSLTMRIADNGKWKVNGSSTGAGTKSMQHRASLIGGSLLIEKGEKGSAVVLNVNLR